MSSALISFIGKGRKDREKTSQAYERLTYRFRNGREISSAVFFDALLRAGEFDPRTCILLGTRTSSWATLLDNFVFEGEDESLLELYSDLEAAEEDGVPDNKLEELSRAMTDIWRRPVRCEAHDAEISDENALDIIVQYAQALTNTEESVSEYIVDITHSFRSMPTLFMVSLQIDRALTNTTTRSISVVYGELALQNRGKVRYLHPVWEGYRLAQSIRFFFEQFDAEQLAAQIQSFWPEGEKAVSRFGSVVQSMCLTKIDEVVRQLGNALKKDPAQAPDWYGPLKQRLVVLHKRLDQRDRHRVIASLADLLAENRNYGLALISLQLALEAFILHKGNALGDYGDFDAMYDKTAGHWPKFMEGKPGDIRKKCGGIRDARNMVAHGGAQRRGGGLPQPENLPRLYRTCRNNLKDIFSVQ